jgi:hypothetical protein
VPGDDPRRINWKLYGHGGELFVREGEREPPPHSNILILIDAQFDPLLYSAEMARNGVDLLCENALAAALASTEAGIDVLISHTGRTAAAEGGLYLRANTPAGSSAALAWPAALPLSAETELPAAPGDRGVLIFALPRTSAEPSALDRFLKNHANRGAGRNKARTVELIFLYDGRHAAGSYVSDLAPAAETCSVLYKRRPGVRARVMPVN